jgi:hypothetical protein
MNLTTTTFDDKTDKGDSQHYDHRLPIHFVYLLGGMPDQKMVFSENGCFANLNMVLHQLYLACLLHEGYDMMHTLRTN